LEVAISVRAEDAPHLIYLKLGKLPMLAVLLARNIYPILVVVK
jgi:hypothetical protein